MTQEIYNFSAPGRTEICGNHTDHQHGCVIAAAVDMETEAKLRLNGENYIRIRSEGYEPFEVELGDTAIHEDEKNSSAALCRGIMAAFMERGARLRGFEAEISSKVLPGSGLSSSAAFEVLLGRIMNGLFMEEKLGAVEIARIGQYAENRYFGKPCGLMDQCASSVGGTVYIDFEEPEKPKVERLDFRPEDFGYRLIIIDSGAEHSGLGLEYAAITEEMLSVAAAMGKTVLREVDELKFRQELPRLRRELGDRALLRAMHFFDEQRRVTLMRYAIKNGDMELILRLMNESGSSSWRLLQNISPVGADIHQALAFTLATAESLLQGDGAVRVHGGGFAGTAQAMVPADMTEFFVNGMEQAIGKGRCHILRLGGKE